MNGFGQKEKGSKQVPMTGAEPGCIEMLGALNTTSSP